MLRQEHKAGQVHALAVGKLAQLDRRIAELTEFLSSPPLATDTLLRPAWTEYI
jgi:hypothetical protein